MTVRQNQGFRKDLNFEENTNDTQALSNLGGVGLANDLRVIQNNLKNTSTLGFVTFTNGFFSFPDRESVFTNDDVVLVNTEVNVGSTVLTTGTNYYVCNSNGETQFKLSTTPSTSNLGINTITVTSVSPSSFNFIRKDAVYQENLVNFIEPDIQDTENFGGYLAGSINSIFDDTQANNESAKYFIGKKYKGTENTETDKDIKFEGTVNLFDPAQFNVSQTQLSDAQSPGIFIGDTRAFSADNNPWEISGSTLRTFSEEVTIGDLFFYDDITITGVSTVSGSEVNVTSFTHKVPVAINGETYYLLLST